MLLHSRIVSEARLGDSDIQAWRALSMNRSQYGSRNSDVSSRSISGSYLLCTHPTSHTDILYDGQSNAASRPKLFPHVVEHLSGELAPPSAGSSRGPPPADMDVERAGCPHFPRA